LLSTTLAELESDEELSEEEEEDDEESELPSDFSDLEPLPPFFA
jgi:hypothetical protein